MGFQDKSKEILEAYEDLHIKLMELNSLYKRISTLPITAKKEMIILHRARRQKVTSAKKALSSKSQEI